MFVRNAGHIKVKKLLKNKYVKNKDSVNAGSLFFYGKNRLVDWKKLKVKKIF